MRNESKPDKDKAEKARDTWHKSALEHDEILEKYIKEYPGLTSVQLEKIFEKNQYKFKRSYIKNALSRLEKKKKIMGKISYSDDGKIVKKYYDTYGHSELKKFRNEIEIPVELLNNIEKWKHKAYIYSIKNNEIIITSEENSEFKQSSFFFNTTITKIENNVLILGLPEPIVNYYQIDYDNMDWEIQNDYIIINITSKPTKKIKEKIKGKILLLEDSDYWAGAFKNRLTSIGYTVYDATNLITAQQIISNEKISFMILDDEINFSREAEKFFVNAKKKNRKLKGIFITSYPITDAKREWLTKIGFSSIIDKKSDGDNRQPEVLIEEQIARLEVS